MKENRGNKPFLLFSELNDFEGLVNFKVYLVLAWISFDLILMMSS